MKYIIIRLTPYKYAVLSFDSRQEARKAVKQMTRYSKAKYQITKEAV